MKKIVTILSLAVLALIGAARFIDFLRFTSLETGFFTHGSLVLRYIILFVGIAICALPLLYKKPTVSASEFTGAGLYFICIIGVLCEIFGAFLYLQAVIDEFSWLGLLRGVLFSLLGLWCFYAAVYALRTRGVVRHGSLIAVLGGGALYLTVLERVLVSPSSLHRMWPVLDVLSLISALLFFTMILKAVYNKKSNKPYRRLAAFGLSTFFLSTCIQAPCAFYLFTLNLMHLNNFLATMIFALFGIIGAVVAQQIVAQ